MKQHVSIIKNIDTQHHNKSQKQLSSVSLKVFARFLKASCLNTLEVAPCCMQPVNFHFLLNMTTRWVRLHDFKDEFTKELTREFLQS